MNFLRQNTACEIILCSKQPITDCVDGKTPIEVLTLANITAAIYKGTTRTVITLTASGGDNNLIHIADGYWRLSLTVGNLDTVGRFKITLRDDDVFLAVSEEFFVLPANVYDALCGTDNLEAKLTSAYDAAKSAASETNATANKEAILDAIPESVNISELTDLINDKVVECDSYFDMTKSPWQLVVCKKGDPTTEYSRKNAYDKDGAPITSITQVIAKLEEPV